MRIISRQKILEFTTTHGKSSSALDSWYRIVKSSNFSTFQELRATFPSVDKVTLPNGKSLTIFNIGGNKIRLIAAIHYNSQMLFIRHVMTHAEYDKNKRSLKM